jgi:chemotaxis protein CheD
VNPVSAPDLERAASGTLFLHAGQLFAGARETREIHTIVGSCVAVCLWHPGLGLSGINHYLLPARPTTNVDGGRALSYGEVALPALIDRLLSLGAVVGELEAKVFGGARLVGDTKSTPLGARNVEFAFEGLRTRGVHVVAHDVGGLRGRKLVLDPTDGSVRVRLL